MRVDSVDLRHGIATPYPWEVRAGAGPAGGGLRGHTDASQILIISDMIRAGKGLIKYM